MRTQTTPFVHTQVYLLGRMGNASRALHLIIEKLEDIPQVRWFVWFVTSDL